MLETAGCVALNGASAVFYEVQVVVLTSMVSVIVSCFQIWTQTRAALHRSGVQQRDWTDGEEVDVAVLEIGPRVLTVDDNERELRKQGRRRGREDENNSESAVERVEDEW